MTEKKTVSRETLRTFLTMHAKRPEMIYGAMEATEPFFARAESGRDDLSAVLTLALEYPAEVAIEQTFHVEVKRIVFISRSARFPRPEWMSAKVYDECIGKSIGRHFRVWLGSLGIKHWDASESRGWEPEENPRPPLAPVIDAAFGFSRSDPFTYLPKDYVKDALLYYLSAVLWGELEQAIRLAPLLRLLTKAIPIGEKDGEPGTWLVLVA